MKRGQNTRRFIHFLRMSKIETELGRPEVEDMNYAAMNFRHIFLTTMA